MLCFRGIFTALLPFLIGRAIDSLSVEYTKAALLRIAVLLLVVAVLKGVSQYFMRWFLITISRDIEYDLRNDLTGHLFSLDRRFYERFGTTDLMARATNDLAQVRSLLGPGLMYTGEISVIFLAVLVVMASTDWLLTLVVFAPMPIVSSTVGFFGRRTYKQYQKSLQSFSAMSVRVNEHLSVLRMLRAYNQDEQEKKRFGLVNDGYLEANMGLVRIWRTFYPIMELLVGVISIAVLGFGGWRVLEGHITVGTFVMFIYFLGVLTWPMVGMGVVVNITQRGVASLGRLNTLLQQKPLIADNEETRWGYSYLRGDIEFKAVTVQYPTATKPALNKINLRIPAGKSLAIIGPVGSGKSTLVSLISRVMDPTEGQLLVDGVDVRQIPLSVLRSSIGFVPQETILFNTTLRENICLGAPDATSLQIQNVVSAAVLDTEIDSFPHGMDTMVGERGITLSGGQKQRVALARALLREPRILILDDTTSSIDAETEHKIFETLRVVMRNRTALIVSNRVSAGQLADFIVVLDEGRIAEKGTHRTLLRRKGIYFNMRKLQQLEQELTLR